MTEWIKVKDRLPKIDIAVKTKIEDSQDICNIQTLIYCKKFEWLSDRSISVYLDRHIGIINKKELKS